MRTRLLTSTLTALAALVTFVGLAPTAVAQTNISGGINVDTMWTVAGSPYIMTGDVSVQTGATLTIEPGVTVQATGSDTELIVRGALSAAGTAALPIEFEANSPGTRGAWEGIRVESSGLIELSDVQIRDADYAIDLSVSDVANVTISGVSITNFQSSALYFTNGTSDQLVLSFLTIDGGASLPTYGIFANDQRLSVRDSWIRSVRTGLDSRNSTQALLRTIIESTSQDAVNFYPTSAGTYALDIDYCTFWNNVDVLEFRRQSTSSSYRTNVSVYRSLAGENTGFFLRDAGISSSYRSTITQFSENVYWDTALSTNTNAFTQTRTLNYAGLLADPVNGDFEPTDRSPARYYGPGNPAATIGAVAHNGALTGAGVHGFWYEDHTFAAESTTDVLGDIVVTSGVTMTLLPGATLRMAPVSDIMRGGLDINRIEFTVEGTLEADGTNSRPVTLTTSRDPAQRGDWYGIVIQEDTEAFNVSQVDLSYAYRGVSLYNNDHIVAGSDIHHASDAGIWVSGGTPEVEGVRLYDNRQGMRVQDSATVQIRETDMFENTQRGLDISNSSVVYNVGLVYDNGAEGVSSDVTSSGTRSLFLRNLTIAHNGDDGLRVRRSSTSSSFQLTPTLRDCSVTHNTGFGVRDEAISSSYRTNFTCLGSNVWGNSGSFSNTNGNVAGCTSYNPLYTDIDIVDGTPVRDYAPTVHSPNRMLGSGATLIGALPYVGAIGPQIEGFFWEDFTFTEANSPYTVLGDLIVPAGVTVTFEPGAELLIAPNTDDMGGGNSTARVEIDVLDGGTVTFDGSGDPIVLRPDSDNPALGSWIGLYLTDAGTSTIDNVSIEYATTGVQMEGPSAPSIEDVFILYPSSGGVFANDVGGSPNVDILATQVIGTGSTGHAYRFTNSSGMIRSSYSTHTGTGVYAEVTTPSIDTVSVVNNTFVNQTTGIQYRRTSTSSSYRLTMNITNNVVAYSSSRAVYDSATNSSSYSTTDNIRNNNFYQSSTVTGAGSRDVYTGNITSDPLIEDDSWQSFPRWWDGKLWRESLAINQGLTSGFSIPSRDLFGNARNLGGGVDMGAWEFDSSANEEPRSDAVEANIMVPRGEAFTFDGSGAFDPDGTIASAFWTMSDGTVTAGQSVQHTFAAAGPAWGYITIIDNDGAEDHTLVDVNVNVRPIADAGPAVFQDEGPLEDVFFDGTLSSDPDGNVVSWLWDFGDGSPLSSQESPRHSYASAGLYTVTLTVTDNEGLTDTDTTLATVFGSTDTVGPLITHGELADGQPINAPVTVNATIRDPSSVTSAVLFYRPQGGAAAFALMTNSSGDTYTADIPTAALQSGTMEYWFVAADGVTPTGNTTTAPSGAPGSGVFDFIVVGDTDAPEIAHSEFTEVQPNGVAVTISATITDETGVGSASLYFRNSNGSTYGSVNMVNATGDLWTAQVPAFAVSPPGVVYYIEAYDTSPIPNQALLPTDAPTSALSFDVGSGDTTPPIVVHTPVSDGQLEGVAVPIVAAASDSGDGVDSVSVFYRVAGAPAYTELALVSAAASNWTGEIPAMAVTTAGVQYYIVVLDEAGNSATSPSGAPPAAHTFTVTANDIIPPAITHTPLADGQAAGVAAFVEAEISDASGLSFAMVAYKTAGFPFFQNVAMTNTSGDTWSASIPSFAVSPPSMEYYIFADDTEGNRATAPSAGSTDPHEFTIVAADNDAPTVVHVPIDEEQPDGVDVDIDVTVLDDSAVSVTLSYRVAGATDWTDLVLVAAGGDLYSGAIPGASVSAPGVEYYVTADDIAGNSATSPSDAPVSFHGFDVAPPDLEAPTIVHTEITDGQTEDVAQVISVSVFDDSDVNEVLLSYRVSGVSAWTDVSMVQGIGAVWSATIPSGFVQVPGVEYYVTAVDGSPAANEGVAPTGAPTTPYGFTVVSSDTTGPAVTHSAASTLPFGQSLAVAATVTDETGVASLTLRYQLDDGGVVEVPMVESMGTWTASIAAVSITNGTAIVGYTIAAIDTVGNASNAPSVGRYETTIVYPDTTPPTVAISDIATEVVAGTAIAIEIDADDTESGVSTVRAFYAVGASDIFTELVVSGSGPYVTSVPGAAVVLPSVRVYATATDGVGNADSTDESIVTVVLPPDVLPPVVELSDVADGQEEGADVVVSATVTDESGVLDAVLFHRVSGSGAVYTSVDMVAGPDDSWTATIVGAGVQLPGVDYYVSAVDASAGENQGFGPSTAPGTPAEFSVTSSDTAGPTISHSPPPLPIYAGTAVNVSVMSTDASGVQGVSVFYRTTGTTDFVELAMTEDATVWSADVPAVEVPGFDYYFVAEDTLGNEKRFPLTAPTTWRSRPVVVLDDVGPSIDHTPVTATVEPGTPVVIDAVVTDATGVAAVTLAYRTPGGLFTMTAASAGPGDTYTALIPGAAVVAPGIEYYLSAVDTDGAANTSASPSDAPTSTHSFDVEEVVVDTTPPMISGYAPPTGPIEARTSIPVEVSVTDDTGVMSVRLAFRTSGDTGWLFTDMVSAGGDSFAGAVPSSAVLEPGVEFYVVATDTASAMNQASAPAGAPTSFTSVDVFTPDTAGPVLADSPIADGQPLGVPVTVSVTATDDSGVGSVFVYYRTTGGGFTELQMSLAAGGARYEAEIPGASVQLPSVDYYFVATDSADAANESRLPLGAPATVLQFSVVDPDGDAPVIVHTPVADGQVAGAAVALSADISDASGVGAASLNFRPIGASDWFSVGMRELLPGTWSASIAGVAVTAAGVEYYISAVDDSDAANMALAPASAPATGYTFTVQTPDTSGPVLAHTPLSALVAGQAAALSVTATDDTEVAAVSVFYRPQGTVDWLQASLTNTAGDTWAGNVGAFAVLEPGLEYYFTASDTLANSSTLPAGAPASPYRVAVSSSDTLGPDVTHSPPAELEASTPFVVRASISDASGVDSAQLFFRAEGDSWLSTPMRQVGAQWEATVSPVAVRPPSLEYYIEATDASSNENTTSNATSSWVVTVVAPDVDGPTITHTPFATDRVAGATVTVSATVVDEGGVERVTLFFRRAGDSAWLSSAMSAAGDSYSADIPSVVVADPAVEYYFEAEDTAGNGTLAPLGAPTISYRFDVVTPDTTPPTIELDDGVSPVYAGMDYRVSGYVEDESGIESVSLSYRAATAEVFTVAPMSAEGRGIWAVTIPGAEMVEGTLELYVEAQDAAGNVSQEPIYAELGPILVQVLAIPPVDLEGPAISHTPVESSDRGAEVTLSAVVVDPSGVASVNVWTRLDAFDAWVMTAMTDAGADTWSVTLPSTFTDGALLEYYLEAVDGAELSNTSVMPALAPAEWYPVALQDVTDPDAGDAGDAGDVGDVGDAGMDVGDTSDGGTDVQDDTDASEDVEDDTQADVGDDTSADAGTDATPDAGADAGPDTGTVDVQADGAGSDAGEVPTGGGGGGGGGCAAATPLAAGWPLMLLGLLGLRTRRRRD